MLDRGINQMINKIHQNLGKMAKKCNKMAFRVLNLLNQEILSDRFCNLSHNYHLCNTVPDSPARPTGRQKFV